MEYAKENPIDCAFLDIELGGGRSGIQLGEKLKELQPDMELVFVTAYDQYARASYRVGGRAYLTKPYTQEELGDTLEVLQKLIRATRGVRARQKYTTKNVLAKTFGNFDLLVNGVPVAFKNAKAKELLAYLVNQRGGTVSSAQIFLALWEHQEYTSVTSTYVRRTVRALKDELEELEISDLLISRRNCYSVDSANFICDYYDLMSGERSAVDQYNGEYMGQYSWGESTIPLIERKIDTMKIK